MMRLGHLGGADLGMRCAEEHWCLYHALYLLPLRLPPRHVGLRDCSIREMLKNLLLMMLRVIC